jgi:murein hydrolase activator
MPKFLLSLILLCCTSMIWGQESQQEKLEKRKAQIQQEIRENEKMLQSVKKKEKAAVSVVMIQSNKIKLKEKLISTTERQAKLLSNDIYLNQLKVNKLNRELVVLKEDYAKMIVKSYKSRSEQSRAMFILSSSSFLQAYKRAQYMKQYTSFRKMQGDEIKSKSDQLIEYNEKLGVQKSAKQKLIEENEKERLALLKVRQEQEKLLKSIKKDKSKIAAEIKKRQSESRAIDRQIDRLIREAIAEANRKAALEKAMAKAKSESKSDDTKESIKTRARAIVSSSASVSTSKLELTPEAKILSDNFKSNKGRLPWPVEKGFVSSPFGNHPHPVISSLMVHNSGVDITTEQGATARAVFSGEVTSVIVLSPVNRAVMIQHGEYFTVYQNLSSVFVSKGDKVNTKQSIGKVRTNGDTGKTIIKFMISQNTTYNNPASWLSAM